MVNKSGVNNFIENLYCNDGSFKFSPTSLPNVYTTCFAVLALGLINKLDNFPEIERQKIERYIKSFQNSDSGIFCDTNIKKNRTDFHDQEYIDLQLTDFSILALTALGSVPESSLGFLKKYKDIDYLECWLKNLNWSDPWKISNLIMFVLNFLIFENEKENEQYIDFILTWLNKHQDSKNGLWNLGYRSSYINQFAGAYHFLFFYTYLNKKPNYTEKIIDSVLNVQNYDGLFTYWGGGGSCEDLDAIDLLCRCSFYTEYRRTDIENALKKAYSGLLKNQNEDGGFCWAKRCELSFEKIIYIIEPKLLTFSSIDFLKNAIEKTANLIMVVFSPTRLSWKYSGIESMKIRYDQSDMWSTWFRLLSIALIEETFPKMVDNKKTFNWKMRKKSGLGFYK